MMNGYEYTDMDAILAGSFRAAIYCRLSKDDDLDGESASIANQRDMLESYCEKQGDVYKRQTIYRSEIVEFFDFGAVFLFYGHTGKGSKMSYD